MKRRFSEGDYVQLIEDRVEDGCRVISREQRLVVVELAGMFRNNEQLCVRVRFEDKEPFSIPEDELEHWK